MKRGYWMFPLWILILLGVAKMQKPANKTKSPTPKVYNLAEIRAKNQLNKGEVKYVIGLVHKAYPLTAVISEEVLLGIARQESEWRNNALRVGTYPDISYGLMQLIQPTAETLKKKYPNLPNLSNFNQRGYYESFRDPYASIAYGATLIQKNYRMLTRYTKAPMNEAIRAYNTGVSNRMSSDGTRYLNEVISKISRIREMTDEEY